MKTVNSTFRPHLTTFPFYEFVKSKRMVLLKICLIQYLSDQTKLKMLILTKCILIQYLPNKKDC